MEQACRQIETPGQEQSKYGLMYIHFNSLCLETFGKENQRKLWTREALPLQFDSKTQEKLTIAKKGLLIKIGITFTSS